MDLFALFRRRSPKRPKIGYAVLIDIPNIQTIDSEDGGGKRLMSWELLLTNIRRKHYGRMLPLVAHAYTRVFGNKAAHAELERSLLKGGVELKPLQQKDVDSLIAADFWKAADMALQQGMEELVIIICSGDHIYAYLAEDMREYFRSRLPIRLVVYGWKSSMSGRYKRLVRFTDRYELDEMPGIELQAPTGEQGTDSRTELVQL